MRRVERVIKEEPRKRGNLDYEYILGLARAASLGDGSGLALDPSGASLPWILMSLDRIDPLKPYSKGNVRILCWPLNWLRRETLCDDTLDEFLNRIKGHEFARPEDKDARIPGTKTMEKWLREIDELEDDSAGNEDDEDLDDEEWDDEDLIDAEVLTEDPMEVTAEELAEFEKEEQQEAGEGGAEWMLKEFENDEGDESGEGVTVTGDGGKGGDGEEGSA